MTFSRVFIRNCDIAKQEIQTGVSEYKKLTRTIICRADETDKEAKAVNRLSFPYLDIIFESYLEVQVVTSSIVFCTHI